MNLNNWQQSSTVAMIVSDGVIEQEYRLTFGTCNNFDIGLFNRRRGKIFDHMRKTYGDEWTANDEAMTLMSVMISHAMILSALKQVEAKTGDVWEKTKLPDAWYDWQRFPYEVPAGMVDTLTEAVLDAGNPARLFAFMPVGDEEKKILRLTVTP
jgi:hypothetical protein